jgi:hypothetical protein
MQHRFFIDNDLSDKIPAKFILKFDERQDHRSDPLRFTHCKHA